jgi:tRNA A37 methylthiotransferase MiaB
VVNDRIDTLNRLAQQHSYEFRQQFLNEIAEVLVEHDDVASHAGLSTQESGLPLRHGRSERYFSIYFPSTLPPGTAAKVRITDVTPTHTFGSPA